MYLPLGYKVLKKIENIVREEMDQAGSQELLMPALIPEEVYVASGRRDNFGSSMFSLKDRFNKSYVLGPTHEELFAVAAGKSAHTRTCRSIYISFRRSTGMKLGLVMV